MKKNRLVLLRYVVVIAFITMVSCRKDTVEEPLPPPLPTDLVCTGNGSDSYHPLAINNEWTFPAISFSSNNFSYKIYRTKVFNSVTYFEVADTRGNGSIYLRKDTNGDIIKYDSNSGNEYLFIPASPTINQSWNYTSGTSRKVISTSSTVTTSKCTYTDCLQIDVISSTGNPLTSYYYKKGYGQVKEENLGIGGVALTLVHLLLY